MSAGDSPAHGAGEAPSVVFRSVVDDPPGSAMAELFRMWWPAYRRWFLRDGEHARSSYAQSLRALRRHMPELVPAYEHLLDVTDAGDLEARFLSLWDPPPFIAACSMAAWTADAHPSLIRTYDYVPSLCETTLLTTRITDRRTMAMSDCLWGVLDGINEDGLAVALAFGGRTVIGRGFAVTLLLRYLLEQCGDVAQAVEAMRCVPVNLSYNVVLVDAAGEAALVRVSPDHPPIVTRGAVCAANRQGETEWPEHAAATETVLREEAMAAALADPAMTVERLEELFLAPPIRRDPMVHAWGTVYTARYDTRTRTVRLLWPEETLSMQLDTATDAELTRPLPSLLPPLAHAVRDVPRTPQVIFA